MSDIAQLEQELLASIAVASDEAALEAMRVAALGRNGSINLLLGEAFGIRIPFMEGLNGVIWRQTRTMVYQAMTQ